MRDNSPPEEKSFFGDAPCLNIEPFKTQKDLSNPEKEFSS